MPCFSVKPMPHGKNVHGGHQEVELNNYDACLTGTTRREKRAHHFLKFSMMKKEAPNPDLTIVELL